MMALFRPKSHASSTDRLDPLLDQARRDYMAERSKLWRLRDGPRSSSAR